MSPTLMISVVLVGWLVVALVLGLARRHWRPPVLATAAFASWLLAMQQVWNVMDGVGSGQVLDDPSAVPPLGMVYIAATAVFLVASVVTAFRAIRSPAR